MTKFNGVIVDGIGAGKLQKAEQIAREESALDATGEDIIYIDTASPEALYRLRDENIISNEDAEEIVNRLINQLVLIA